MSEDNLLHRQISKIFYGAVIFQNGEFEKTNVNLENFLKNTDNNNSQIISQLSCYQYFFKGLRNYRLGFLSNAKEDLNKALVLDRDYNYEINTSRIHTLIGWIALDNSDIDEASSSFGLAYSLAKLSDNNHEMAFARLGQAELERIKAAHSVANNLFTESLIIFQEISNLDEIAFCYFLMGINQFYLVQAGMTTSDALVAATKNGFLTLGKRSPKSGELKIGYDADLLLLRSNPLDDITILQDRDNIQNVIKHGKIVV